MNTRTHRFQWSSLLALAAAAALLGCGGGGGGYGGGGQMQPPLVSLSSTALAFGPEATGTTSASQAVTVDNTGGDTLTVSGVTPSGANLADFAQTNNCGAVAAGTSCTVNVTFTPSASGAASATLNIASNAASSPDTVGLTGTGTPAAGANTVAATVDTGPTGNGLNILYVTVTVCAPGTATCQTIDHMQLDTGSQGVRILSEVLLDPLKSALTTRTSGAGHALVECAQFGDGYSWGPVKTVDLTMSGRTAAGLSVHVIGDPAYPPTSVPTPCKNGPGGPNEEDTVAAFGANGIVGVGYFLQDCGTGCPADGTVYSDCIATTCSNYAATTAEQVANPVGQFATDNNGVIVQLPAVVGAATSLSGSLVFGIGTAANNALPSGAIIYQVSPTSGEFTAQFASMSLTHSFVDSGSNAYFFPNIGTPMLMPCVSPNASFYCPATDTTVSADIMSFDGLHSLPVTVPVKNLNELVQTDAVFPGLAGTITGFPSSFDFGLPFFFGKSVYVAFEGTTLGTTAAPALSFD